MILSITVYTLLAVALFLLGDHLTKRESRVMLNDGRRLPWYAWEVVAGIALFTLMMGLRYGTGSDYFMYLDQYQNVICTGKFGRPDFEPGFYLITLAFAKLRVPYPLYFAFWALLQATLLFYALRQRKFLLQWLCVVLILGPFFYNLLTFMRQWVVSAMALCMLPLIQRRKFWLFVLLTLLASSLHRSAFLLLAFYFAAYLYKGDGSVKFYLSIFAVAVLLGIYPFWFRWLGFLTDILPIFDYEKYAHHIVPVINGDFRDVGWGPLHLLGLASETLFIVYYPRVRDFFKDDKLLPLAFMFAFACACYSNLMMNTYYGMLRPAVLTNAISAVMIAYVLTYLWQTRRYWQLACGLLLTCSYTYATLLKFAFEVGDYSTTIFYHFLPFS